METPLQKHLRIFEESLHRTFLERHPFICYMNRWANGGPLRNVKVTRADVLNLINGGRDKKAAIKAFDGYVKKGLLIRAGAGYDEERGRRAMLWRLSPKYASEYGVPYFPRGG